MSKETARRGASLEPRTSRSPVRVVNRSATRASTGIAINKIMYKKFSAQKEHLGKCKRRVAVEVVRGGGGARRKLRVIRRRAELRLPLLTRGTT